MLAKDKLFRYLQDKLRIRQKKYLYRSLTIYEKNKYDFSSNDYLGLNFDGILKEFFIISMEKFVSDSETIGSTGSRLISGHRKIFEEVELLFANYVENQEALFFTNGYIANLSSIFALLDPDDYAFVDRLCHASILDGIRISKAKRVYFHHNDLNHLEEQLKKQSRNRKNNRFWIFTESIFSMDGDIPPLKEMITIAEKYECNLFLDEAHSIGIYGNSGKGLASDWKLQNLFSVLTYPMGKAPGISGCFVVGDPLLKKYLINFSRGLIFSTAPPVFLLYFLKELIPHLFSDQMEERRNRVRQLSLYAKEQLIRNGFNVGNTSTHIIPIILKEEKLVLDCVQYLRNHHFEVVGIRPPTVPAGTSRIRLNIHAHNTQEQIDELLYLLSKYHSNNIVH